MRNVMQQLECDVRFPRDLLRGSTAKMCGVQRDSREPKFVRVSRHKALDNSNSVVEQRFW